MLNTKKLLYILPDVAYVAELLPTKKAHEFSVQSFRQVNGKFMDENDLIDENIEKLINKLEPEDYHLILPDFLFTNTIVEIEEKTESGVDKHIKSKLLPDLKIDKESHEISTTTLNAHGGKTRVQLSALEKVVLQAIRKPAAEKKIKITNVSPLSWTIKSVVSLEPSITVIQIGSKLYLAQHYIGVDQCVSKDISEIDAISETIKTLKGAEPSIQTVYLLTNPLVEKNLKELLSDTLPMQQLTSSAEDEEGLPSFVRQIIESSSKTLDIKDFPVPKFSLGKSVSTMPKKTPKTNEEEKPARSASSAADAGGELEEVKKDDTNIETIEIFDDEDPSTPSTSSGTDKEAELPEPAEPEDEKTEEPEVKPSSASSDAEALENKKPEVEEKKEDPSTGSGTSEDDEPDVEQFAVHKDDSSTPSTSSGANDEDKDEDEDIDIKVESEEEKPVIKNKANSNLPKMLFITLSVFFVTVAIGIGIGLAILQLSKGKSEDIPTPVVEETPDTQVEATPEPTPEPVTIDKSEYSILVVNATTTSGYAGTIKAKLDEDEYKELGAANAKGDYDAGYYLLLDEENNDLFSILSDETELDLVYDEELDKDTEDATGDYDAVIVLAESEE